MAGTSKLTKVVSIRLPIGVYTILERRTRTPGMWRTPTSYCQQLVIWYLTRKHKKGQKAVSYD